MNLSMHAAVPPLPGRPGRPCGSRIFMLFALLAAACGGDAPVDPDNGPADVQRATLEIRVSVTSQDQAVASRLGFTSGVPGVEVEIERAGTGARFSALSRADGMVTFQDLLEGDYRVSGVRVLEPAERLLLTDGAADVNALAGAASVRVDPAAASTELLPTAGRPGSLVTSEIWHGNFAIPSTRPEPAVCRSGPRYSAVSGPGKRRSSAASTSAASTPAAAHATSAWYSRSAASSATRSVSPSTHASASSVASSPSFLSRRFRSPSRRAV